MKRRQSRDALRPLAEVNTEPAEPALIRTVRLLHAILRPLTRRDWQDQNKIPQAGAVIFVCGDGGKMEPDVKRKLMDIYREKAGADEAAAQRWIDDMGTQNRYVLDVWAGS